MTTSLSIRSDADLLYEVVTAMSEADAFDEAMERMLEAVCRHTGWPFGQIWLPSEDRQHLLPGASWSAGGSLLDGIRKANAEARLVPGEGIAGTVWSTGRTRWLAGFAPGMVDEHASVMAKAGIASEMGFPAWARQEVVAVLTFAAFEVRGEDEELFCLVDAVASVIGSLVLCRRIEDQLLRSRAELERSNDDLMRFASVVSHDLQEPLRMVASFVQLLGDRYSGQLDAKADEFIAYAVSGTDRMRALIQDLLEYSQAGQAEGPRPSQDTQQIVADVLADLDPLISSSGAEVDVGALSPVCAHRIEVVQLFANLLRNAIRFSEPGSARIMVRAEELGDQVRIAVADRGIGVPQGERERIFLPFTRLQGQEEVAGTGIGLAICRRIVERLGGSIWMEPNPTSGSIFRFTLPAG